MAGAGNDFILIDGPVNGDLKKMAVKACDRTGGIGADGIIVLDKSRKADYRMRIINADGSEAEMCGNGARCLAAYIVRNRKPKKKLFSIDTLAGTILAQARGETANVRLSDPKDYRADIEIDVNRHPLHVSYIDTGVPHAIVYVDDLEMIDVYKLGQVIRHHGVFKPRGTNVNFVEQQRADLVDVRTFERGVENETKACGTGSVAAAIVTYLKSHPQVKSQRKARMSVRTRGKEILDVTFDIVDGHVTNVWLKGSAKFIARGEYYL